MAGEAAALPLPVRMQLLTLKDGASLCVAALKGEDTAQALRSSERLVSDLERLEKLVKSELASEATRSANTKLGAGAVAWRSKMPMDTKWVLTEHEPTVAGICKDALVTATALQDGIEPMRRLAQTLRSLKAMTDSADQLDAFLDALEAPSARATQGT